MAGWAGSMRGGMISDALDTIEEGGQRHYEAETVSATPRCCR
jgi:hypothetical protein